MLGDVDVFVEHTQHHPTATHLRKSVIHERYDAGLRKCYITSGVKMESW